MVFNQDEFCSRVKQLRKLKKLNKFQMSIQANILYQYYCDIENGKRIPNLKGVVSIANALKTNVSSLLSGTTSDVTIYKIAIMENLKSIQNKDTLEKCHEILLSLITKESEKK